MAAAPPPSAARAPLVSRLAQVTAECQQALAGLTQCTGEPAAHIHLLRKRGKRLRGGLELLGAPATVIHELRDMGRILAPTRDAAVRAATFRLLHEQPGESFTTDTDLEVAQSLLAEESALADGTPSNPVLGFVALRLAAVTSWLEAASQAPAAPQRAARLQAIVRRVAKRLRRLSRPDPEPRHFHGARKQVKRLLGAAWFQCAEPDAVRPAPLRRLDALGDDLGLLNDLHVLEAWLDRTGLTAARLPGLHRAIRRRRRRLVTRVRRRAAKFDPAPFLGC